MARLVGAVTPFGLQFDSLADLVSFGLAPALLAFTLFSQGRDEWDPLGWVVCFLWVACAAIRLARFNTTIDPTADKRYFIGMPSPGAAGVVLASVFAFGDQMQGRDRLWVLLVVVVPALLMVSNIRFRSFRSLVSPKSGRPYGLIAAGGGAGVGFALVPVVTGIALAYGYLLAPLLLPIVAPLGRLLPGAAQGGPVMTRPARSGPDDVPAVVALVRELADYEKALHEVRLTEEQLTGVLFGDSPALFGHVAETTTARSSASPCGSSTSPPGAARTASTSRTSTSSPGTAARGLGKELLRTLAGGLRGARLLAAGVVGARLEHPVDRLLQGRRRRPHGRVDRLPPHRRRPEPTSPTDRSERR